VRGVTEESVTAGQTVGEKIIDKVERAVVVALRTLILLLVIGATAILYVLFVRSLPGHISQISSSGGVLVVMQRVFADVLAIILGLELSETLKAYFARHQVRLEVILVLATIAAGRNLIQVDYEHTSAFALIGWGVLILCLTIGYTVVRRANISLPLPPQRPPREDRAPEDDASERMR
jgi:uncharacterized membrane protein (DUF373 family)